MLKSLHFLFYFEGTYLLLVSGVFPSCVLPPPADYLPRPKVCHPRLVVFPAPVYSGFVSSCTPLRIVLCHVTRFPATSWCFRVDLSVWDCLVFRLCLWPHFTFCLTIFLTVAGSGCLQHYKPVFYWTWSLDTFNRVALHLCPPSLNWSWQQVLHKMFSLNLFSFGENVYLSK